MYDCLDCGCKYPRHYDKCPVCKSEKRKREQFRSDRKEPIKEEIKFSPFVEKAEIEDMS